MLQYRDTALTELPPLSHTERHRAQGKRDSL